MSESLSENENDSGSMSFNFFIIPEFLDFTNSTLIVVFLIVFSAQLTYMILPQIAKKNVELLDFDPAKKHTISYTGCCAILTLIMITV